MTICSCAAFRRRRSARLGPTPGGAVPALRAAAMDRKQSKEVQEAIIAALGKLGKNGVDVLIATLKDKDREVDVRRRAIESLGELGPDARSAVATLVEALQGGSPGGKKKEMSTANNGRKILGPQETLAYFFAA